MYDYLIVGAGIAGLVVAERIATVLNKTVCIVERRDHIGGNCYDYRDENGILIHKYGPHLFRTNNKKVFDYLSNFTEWTFYEHKVLAFYKNEYFPIPINKTTINMFFKENFVSEKDVRDFYDSKKNNIENINSSEDLILSQVGEELYYAFFYHYTKKQWDLFPRQLNKEVCGRIPVRFNDDDRYFTDKYQFMPQNGFSSMFDSMTKNKNITILLNTDFHLVKKDMNFKSLIYTGRIDEYFNYKLGKLPYRSVDFQLESVPIERKLITTTINYVEPSFEYTRKTDYSHIYKYSNLKKTKIMTEYPKSNGDAYYPIPSNENHLIYSKYLEEANQQKEVVFIGRLAEYKYYQMDQVVEKALEIFETKLCHY